LRGVEAGTWYGVNALRGTPQADRRSAQRGIVAILKTPAFAVAAALRTRAEKRR
jgi:hypothetical protein